MQDNESQDKLRSIVRDRMDMGIKVYGSDTLIQVCTPLKEVDSFAIDQMVTMEDSLLQVEGKALTGNQIGWNKQVVVADYNDQIHFIINPEITIRYGRGKPQTEFCLSVPDISGEVFRHKAVHVKGYELIKDKGYEIEPLDETFVDLEAQMWQHECEHIKGMFFVDGIADPAIRKSIQDKLKRIDSIRKAYLRE